jgi:hypothetical protein
MENLLWRQVGWRNSNKFDPTYQRYIAEFQYNMIG